MKRKDQHTALAYYTRADSIQITIIRDGDKRMVFAELMPSTAHPNVIGAVNGTKQDAAVYLASLALVAEATGLKVDLEVLDKGDLP